MKRFHIVLILTLLLAGCREKIEPDLEQENPDITIDGTRYKQLMMKIRNADGDYSFPDSLGITVFSGRERLGDGHILRKLADQYCLRHPELLMLYDGDFELIHRAAEGKRRYPVSIRFTTSRGKVASAEIVNYYANLAKGDGSSSNPYLIDNINGTKNSLVALSLAIQQDPNHGKGLYFALAADLDFDTYDYIVTKSVIGYYSGADPSEFRGTFDGAGHEILNYEINSFPYVGAGFFHALGDGATIRNMTFRNAKVSGTQECVGTLAGYTSEGNITVEDVVVTDSDIKGAGFVGGLIGRVSSGFTIKNCWVDGSSEISFMASNANAGNIGGLLGGCEGIGKSEMDFCYIDKKVEVSGFDNVGGIIGSVNSYSCIRMEEIRNYSNYIYANGANCGGIIGKVDLKNGVIMALNKVICPEPGKEYTAPQLQGKSAVGGIIGLCLLDSKSRIELADVSSSGNHHCEGQYYGGFVGHVKSSDSGSLSIVSCTHLANGSVTAGGKYAGGFIGLAQNTAVQIRESSNLSTMDVPADCVGGFAGASEGGSIHMINSYNSGFLSGKSSVGGLVGRLYDSKADIDSSCGAGDLEGRTDDTQIIGAYDGTGIGGMVGYGEKSEIRVYGEGIAMRGFVGSGDNPCDNTGGLIGRSLNSSIHVTGSLEFRCSVTGNTNAGGLIGLHESTKNVGGSIGYGFVSIQGVKVRANGISGYRQVGGIAGKIHGRFISLRDCTVEGSISSEKERCGGMVGYLDSEEGSEELVKGCTNYASVHAYSSAGGIIGRLENDNTSHDHNISACTNYGNIDGVRTIGGIIGYLSEDCQYTYLRTMVNYGEVSNENNDYEPEEVCIGGILGHASTGVLIRYSANMGKVSAHKAKFAGGIAGRIGESVGNEKSKISQCFNAGDIYGGKDCVHVGGIVGGVEDVPLTDHGIYDCYNKGKIVKDDDSVKPAGIASYIGYGVDIHRCFDKAGTKHAAYYDRESSNHFENNFSNRSDCDKDGDTEYLTDAEFMKSGSFTGFDFSEMWEMDTALGHPVLSKINENDVLNNKLKK